MVLVDTTVWIDYLEGVNTPHAEWLDPHLERQRLGLTDILLCEVLQGVRGEAQAKQVYRSFCLLNGHALLHNDRDFDPFERLLGLSVVHP